MLIDKLTLSGVMIASNGGSIEKVHTENLTDPAPRPTESVVLAVAVTVALTPVLTVDSTRSSRLCY